MNTKRHFPTPDHTHPQIALRLALLALSLAALPALIRYLA
jgi:hypothetical protein